MSPVRGYQDTPPCFQSPNFLSAPHVLLRPGKSDTYHVYSGHPAAEIRNTVERQERRLGDLQNDIHQMADSLPGLWEAWASNLTVATTEANQTELGEWQVPGAEEEPGHVVGDEWTGRQSTPRTQSALGRVPAPAGLV